jgi:AcrR family transcriptional regulator
MGTNRTGRPVGADGGTRDRILEAARAEFAAKGFEGATMRSIAATAHCDVALLSHYFGSKSGLFAETMDLPARARGAIAESLTGPLEAQGERLARTYLGLWENPETSAQMHMLMRSALNNEAAAARLHTLLTAALDDERVAPAIAGRRTGFALAMSHLFGLAFARYLLRIPPAADVDVETLVARTAPALQLHLATTDSASRAPASE